MKPTKVKKLYRVRLLSPRDPGQPKYAFTQAYSETQAHRFARKRFPGYEILGVEKE